MDERYVSEEEKAARASEKNHANLASGFYTASVESVKANFSEWRNVALIEGSIPETLSQVHARKVAYLHLDMNCSPPEVAAASFFWDRLVAGAFILLDDYAYYGYRAQKSAMDSFAATKRCRILSLPTGQGLLIKPPPNVANDHG